MYMENNGKTKLKNKDTQQYGIDNLVEQLLNLELHERYKSFFQVWVGIKNSSANIIDI